MIKPERLLSLPRLQGRESVGVRGGRETSLQLSLVEMLCSSAPGPGGGFTWDGRTNTLAEQAKTPLLSSFEMANASVAEVVAKLKSASYAALFRQAFGNQAFDDANSAFNNALAALQAFQLEDPSFHPYSSKFDLFAGNKIGGTVQKFDDLPAAYRANIDPQMPLDGRLAGSPPPLSEKNIADLICFLNTLTNGYQPPSSPPTSGPCVD